MLRIFMILYFLFHAGQANLRSMDIAYDRMPSSSPNIYPGDSAVITVDEPNVGMGVEPHLGTGKAAVYAYVKVTPLTHNTGAPMSGARPALSITANC